MSSGAPLSLSSNRFTTGWGSASTPNLMNMTAKQLEDQMGVFETSTGVYFINPASGLFTIKGATSTPNFCTTGQTTPCFAEPAPGQMGNLSYDQFTLPWFFDQDLSVVKDIQIFERLKMQLRLEAFDVFNNVNFSIGSLASLTASSTSPNSLDSTSFGQLTTTFDTARGGGITSRIVQWGVRFVF